MTTTTTPPETAGAIRRGKLEIAQLLGEDAARIGDVDPSWATLLTEGFLIDLHIGWPRFETQLRHEDLGLHLRSDRERAAVNRLVKLGKRQLRPRGFMRRIARVETSARAEHERRSYRTGWKGRFVPKGRDGLRYLSWKAAMAEYERQFFALRDEMLARWDEHQDWCAAQYAILGYENYDRLLVVPPERRAAMGIDLPDDRDLWVREFVERMMRAIPSKAEAAALFTWDREINYVPLVGMSAEDALAAHAVAVDREAVHEEARALALARTAAERDMLAQRSRDKAAIFTAFIRDVTEQVRGLVYDVCVDCLEAIKRNHGELPPSNQKQIRTLIERISALQTDVVADPELDRQMAALRLMAIIKPTSADPVSPTTILQQIGAETRLKLLAIDRRPQRSARDVGIPDAADGLRAFVDQQRQRRTRVTAPEAPRGAAAEPVDLPARPRRAARPVAALAVAS